MLMFSIDKNKLMAPVELFCGLTSNKKQIFYKPKSDERITSY